MVCWGHSANQWEIFKATCTLVLLQSNRSEFLYFFLTTSDGNAIIIRVQGLLAQLVRAQRWHRWGHRFEFCTAHSEKGAASREAAPFSLSEEDSECKATPYLALSHDLQRGFTAPLLPPQFFDQSFLAIFHWPQATPGYAASNQIIMLPNADGSLLIS